jgi:hypothetical protein
VDDTRLKVLVEVSEAVLRAEQLTFEAYGLTSADARHA